MVRRNIARLRRRRRVMLAPAMLLILAAEPAHAQFSWFGSREASPQDVSDTIADHGFTLVGPLYRNGRVYLADVIDRRRRRERLVIAADSGEIVQRYFVDVGPERRAPVAAPRQAPRDDSFFSHLTRGWDDEPPPRPPVGLPGQNEVVTVPAAPLVRPKPQPRVVTRTEAAPTPVTAAPLPPPGSAGAKPEVVTVPSTASSGDSSPSHVRGTSVSTDPLSIPGTRKAEESRAAKAAAAATVAASKPAEPVAAVPPAVKPKPAPAADVPVAPLD